MHVIIVRIVIMSLANLWTNREELSWYLLFEFSMPGVVWSRQQPIMLRQYSQSHRVLQDHLCIRKCETWKCNVNKDSSTHCFQTDCACLTSCKDPHIHHLCYTNATGNLNVLGYQYTHNYNYSTNLRCDHYNCLPITNYSVDVAILAK